MVLSHPGPPPPPLPVTSQRHVASSPSTTTANDATPSPTTSAARPVLITTTPPDANRGITVYATPLGDGTLSMTETVRFDHRQQQITLSPPKVADAPPAFRHLTPTVSQIELTVDGKDMQIKSHTLTAPLIVMLAPPGAKRVDVRYLLDHVVAAGTAGTTATTALVAPLIDGSMDALNVSYVIGSQINSYGCPQLTTAVAQADCQALAHATTSPVGLISGLPSATSLLVLGLPAGTATPSPSDTPPSPPSPSPSPPATTPPTTTPSTPPPADPTTPPSTPPAPVTATDPPTTPPPSDTPTTPPTDTPPPPSPAPTDTPTPTPTETATPPPPTGTAGGAGGGPTATANTPAAPAAPAVVDPATSGAGAASQVAGQGKAAVQGAATVPPALTPLP